MTEGLDGLLIPYSLLGFGGCVKDVEFAPGAVVNLASVSSSAVRVNLDGCLSPDSAANCTGNNSIPVYRGKEHSVSESGLQAFTGNVGSSQGGMSDVPSSTLPSLPLPLSLYEKDCNVSNSPFCLRIPISCGSLA